MTLVKHPERPDLWVANSPLDFIGWNIHPDGTAVDGKMGIVTLWKVAGVEVSEGAWREGSPDGQFTFINVLTPIYIVPLARVQFIPINDGKDYTLHLHRPTVWR